MSNALITNQKEQIKELIDSSESIGIVVSENQNIDTVAAALSLYLILKSNGKNVQIVSKKEPIVEVSNLVGIDKISKSFSGNTKILTISVPYREGEIEKVSYNIEDTRLNVNLFAESEGITFDEKDVQYIRKGSSPSTIITIGISNEGEISGLVDLAGVKTIHIDKNPLNSLFGDVSIIDPSFSSLSEIVAELVMEADFGYDLDAFQNLMDGIIFATRNFTSQSTSSYAFEAAGFLLANGAKRKERPFDSLDRTPFDRTSLDVARDRQGRQDKSFDRTQGKPFDSTQGKRDDRFPREEHFLNKRPQMRPFGETQSRPFDSTQGKQGNWPPKQGGPASPPASQRGESLGGQNPFVNPPPGQSPPAGQSPLGRRLGGGKNIEEIENIEGSGTGEIPDDWFLPKVFKGSKKGN